MKTADGIFYIVSVVVLLCAVVLLLAAVKGHPGLTHEEQVLVSGAWIGWIIIAALNKSR